MEKNLKKYIYIYLNHFAVHLKLTQHCKSTILQKKAICFGKNPHTPWTVCCTVSVRSAFLLYKGPSHSSKATWNKVILRCFSVTESLLFLPPPYLFSFRKLFLDLSLYPHFKLHVDSNPDSLQPLWTWGSWAGTRGQYLLLRSLWGCNERMYKQVWCLARMRGSINVPFISSLAPPIPLSYFLVSVRRSFWRDQQTRRCRLPPASGLLDATRRPVCCSSRFTRGRRLSRGTEASANQVVQRKGGQSLS